MRVSSEQLEAKVESAIKDAVAKAISDGTIEGEDDAFVVMHPSGHITVTSKSDAGIDAEADEDDEVLPPYELPEAYKDDGRKTLLDNPEWDDHLATHWGF